MPIRTRITRVAHEHGLTARDLARRLGLYPSNIASADAGRRPISLRALGRIAQVLQCGLGDLIDDAPQTQPPVYRGRAAARGLEAREQGMPDGAERGWVHAALLAWQRHAGFHRRPS